MNLKEDWENRARALLAEREGEDFAAELKRARREMDEASFGRVMPDAALKNVLAWEEREKELEEHRKKVAADRERQLATPVAIELGDHGRIMVSRAGIEEVCGPFGIDECVEIAEELLAVFLREGLIKVIDK